MDQLISIMGQTVSTGFNNDELIDNLVEADYIKTMKIQRIFRAVDRASYFLDDQKEDAYRDTAWRAGNLHLSAPCVYSGVMESLKLHKGLSFLNLGSGCGYLSTMAGLILGSYGINHGIEIYNDVIDYAYEKLDEFLKKSEAVDEYDFCEPTFLNGNCLKIDNMQLYDRVYCGAACPLEYETYMKHLIKVGGVLIMPLNNKLLQITRTDESTWEYTTILRVSFAPLMSPLETGSSELVKLPEFSPPSLLLLCRAKIRKILRLCIDIEHPNLQKIKMERCTKFAPSVRQVLIPIINVTDSSDSGNDSDVSFVEDPLSTDSSESDISFIEMENESDNSLSSTAENDDSNSKSKPKKPSKNLSKSSSAEKLPPKTKSSAKRPLSDSESGPSTYSKKRVRMCPTRVMLRNRITSVVCKRFPPTENASLRRRIPDRNTKSPQKNSLSYRKLMAGKIISLPLPLSLQMYINYKRDNICN